MLDEAIEETRLGPNRILVTIATSDMEFLKRAIRNGHVASLDYATQEAIRRYLEWLPKSTEEKKKAFGNV